LTGKLGKGRIDPLGALQSFNAITGTRQPADVHSEIDLTTGIAGAAAFGKASVNVTGTRQEFTVEAHVLSVRSTYKLVVDGVALSSNASANLGSLTFDFIGEPGRSLPASIDPVTKIRHVELRDSLDRVVLQGNFSADSSSPGAGFVERETRLVSTVAMTQAAGHALVGIEALPGGARREQLSLSAEGLISGASYRLIVDGANLGVTFARSGFLQLIFTSDGSSGLLLPALLRPVINIRHIELQDPSGHDVLVGDFNPSLVQSR